MKIICPRNVGFFSTRVRVSISPITPAGARQRLDIGCLVKSPSDFRGGVP